MRTIFFFLQNFWFRPDLFIWISICPVRDCHLVSWNFGFLCVKWEGEINSIEQFWITYVNSHIYNI
jgi:hypothetical protein